MCPGRDTWTHVVLPLSLLGIDKSGETITGVAFQADGKEQQPRVALDDIRLLPDLALPAPQTQATIAVAVDAQADIHPISPLIYGMAFAPASYLTDLRLGVNRWGGNDKSRYNWVQGNACNAARDWGWRNRKAADGDIRPRRRRPPPTSFVPQPGRRCADSSHHPHAGLGGAG